jgi:HlyD family secretion protein
MADSQPSEPTAIGGESMDRRLAKPRRDRRLRWALGVSAGILAVLLVWRLLPAGGSTDIAQADIETGLVQRASFEDYMPVRATVAPDVTTLIDSVSGGQIETLLVQDGARVNAGQALATLDNPTLKLDVLTREADIDSQLGALTGDELSLERSRLDRASQTSSANYDLLKARRDLSIRQQLHDQGFVSDEGVKSYQEEADYQQKRLGQLQVGQAAEDRTAGTQASRLADTRARLTNNLAAVHAELDALTVRAPVAGRLTNFTIQPGQMLKAGDPVGQVDSEGAWKLVADVDEYYLGRVAVGQPASADGGVQLAVTKVLPAVTNGRFRVEVGFRGLPPKGLDRGQAMDIRVTLGATASALVAPVGGWLDSGGGVSVFVVDPDGRHARRRAIRVGRRNPEQAEILSGLATGDRIVTSNTASIKGDILNIH